MWPNEYSARRAGKSWLAHQQKEMLLDAGKTVSVWTPESITRQRRKKHLTVIEELKPKPAPMTGIYDDL